MFGKGIRGWGMTVFALAVVSLLSLRPGAVPVVHAATFTVSNLRGHLTNNLAVRFWFWLIHQRIQ